MKLSIEFFPPKTSVGQINLREARDCLAKELNPDFFSVTYGADGSLQNGTLTTVKDILEAGFDVAPHLTCINSTKDDILELLNLYVNMGVRRIVALRGDPRPSRGTSGEFLHANELVSFIREKTGNWFHIEVAAYPEMHPQSKSIKDDLINFSNKIKAGANSSITQYFYNSDAYFKFIEDTNKLGIGIPITPGIMPITNNDQLIKFSKKCGAEIPRWILLKLESYGDDVESIKKFGVDVVTELCQQLVDNGAPGIHFYSLNKSEPTLEIVKRISF